MPFRKGWTDAVGKHKKDIGGAFLTLLQEIINALPSRHSPYFVGGYDKACGSAGRCRTNHFIGRDQSGLQMSMRIDKSGEKILPLTVDYGISRKVLSDSGNIALFNRYISIVKGSGVGVENMGVSKNQIRRTFFFANLG